MVEPRPQSRDTHPDAERFLIERLRAMSPAEKLELMEEACRAEEAWKLAGLRAQFPGEDEKGLLLRLAYLRLGPELFRKVTGRDLVWEPE